MFKAIPTQWYMQVINLTFIFQAEEIAYIFTGTKSNTPLNIELDRIKQ